MASPSDARATKFLGVISSFEDFKMRCLALTLSATMLVVAVVGAALAATDFDGSAPFGLAWGPLDKIPRPSLALKDVNVTVLLYRRERLPSELPDTEVILLDVCKKEGLQQISWASRSLSTDEAVSKFIRVLAVGDQRYGESKPTSGGALGWENGRIEALSVSEPDGTHRILMVSRGPDFDACSAEHDRASDQSLRARWLRRLELPN
jgi:hypothetical protein